MSTQVFFLQFVLAGILLWSPVAGQQVNPVTIPSYVIPGSNGDQDCCDGHPELQFIVDTLLNPARLETLVTDENCVKLTDTTTAMSTESSTENSSVTTTSTALDLTTDSPPSPCGGPGWRQVVFLDMTNSSQNCPPGLNLTPYHVRSCGKGGALYTNCWSTTFDTGSNPYSKVCGRARGYQFWHGYAFYQTSTNINDYYVHGLSLTHGNSGSRKHIWTFAVGLQTNALYNWRTVCSCDTNATSLPPPFVGNDYYCESGPKSVSPAQVLYSDPLWDGQGCSTHGTCCQSTNLPWFYKTLRTETTDNIELRLCCHDMGRFGCVALEQLELYVK